MTRRPEPPVIWRRRGLILVPVKPPEPENAPEPPYVVSELIACPDCFARIWEHCKTSTGRHRYPHAVRLVPRRCACGRAVGDRKKLCPECRADARRINGRRGMQATRQRRMERAS